MQEVSPAKLITVAKHYISDGTSRVALYANNVQGHSCDVAPNNIHKQVLASQNWYKTKTQLQWQTIEQRHHK